MLENSIYIQPAIKFYSSFNEALSVDSEWDQYLSSKEKWEFKDLFAFPKTFIVAEPGYGKTRLLREIALRASCKGKKAICVESKKIIEATVEEFILNQLKNSSAAKSDGFELKNEESIIICFDALDEVKLEVFSLTVEKIKTFLYEYKKITIIISCRWHFFRKYKELFIDLDFRYARIFPFSKEQVESFLKHNSILQEDIERIFNTLSFRGRDLVIQTPRYLEFMVSYVLRIKELTISQKLPRLTFLSFSFIENLRWKTRNLTGKGVTLSREC